MAKTNYPIEEVKDLVSQLVRITELLIDPPDSIDENVLKGLKEAQYETIQTIQCVVE